MSTQLTRRVGQAASLLTMLALGLFPIGSASGQEPIAVVVSSRSPLTGLSLDELRRYYLGRSTTLSNRDQVILIETAALRDRFYSKALGMNADRFKRHWIATVFAGEGATPPRELGNPEDVIQYVASHPGAIAFVSQSNVSGSVRVLPIGGTRPGDPNYALK